MLEKRTSPNVSPSAVSLHSVDPTELAPAARPAMLGARSGSLSGRRHLLGLDLDPGPAAGAGPVVPYVEVTSPREDEEEEVLVWSEDEPASTDEPN